MDFDVIVIGSGPGGYVTAIRASQLGMKTAIVERENLGGICLNWGCIPTKALLKSGEIYEQLSHLADYGLSVRRRGFDFAKPSCSARARWPPSCQRRRHLPDEEAQDRGGRGLGQAGEGRPAPKVVVALKAGGDRTVTAKHVILATGARARTSPPSAWSRTATRSGPIARPWSPRPPKTLVVIGSGAIGIEFASFYRALGVGCYGGRGCRRILPVEDEEVSKAAHKAFEKRGIKFRVAAKVKKLTKTKAGVSVEIEVGGKAETLTADVAIVAVGIVGNVEDMGLEALGVKIDRTATSSPTATARPTCPASTPSATSPARPGWRTRPATRASTASSTSPA
jgi:dihydrolipoamide dehydrogenase